MSFMPENLNFADLLDDDDIICNSQPISLPSQNSVTEDVSKEVKKYEPRLRPLKSTEQEGRFRTIDEIDPKYRAIFTFPYFNLVQSRVIDDALYSEKSMVVCAPTGSGKTVVFEMAITQLLMNMEENKYTEFKIIYMAPIKALCTERLTEWYPKFTKLGLMCIEVTGDTDVEFPQLKPYSIIITTPEKWDMLTRRWRDYKGLVEVVKLFLIDEVHILNDDVRGPVLEAVVSRMKTIESSVQSEHRIEQLRKQYQRNQPGTEEVTTSSAPRIRFVAVSATVNNPEDVANWLGTVDRPAVYYKFGDECRPVKLNRVVEGYPCSAGTSIFKFDIILNYKLWPIIQKYHNGKPTLIFCNTRKSVALTAEALSRKITITFNPDQKAKLTALASTLKNKKLQVKSDNKFATLILNGVGCHHAGLLFEERMNIELAFRNRDLPILVTTTTLAMGVNLPAHLVIIKNTQQYVNGAYQEYSMSTILQMVGRAGRPQFDTEATAVIMTRMADKARYQALVEGTEPLQSFLHKRLAENLNSEAALGTVTDVAGCVQWVNSTFLSVRAFKDPKRYLGLPQGASTYQITKKIEELCVKAMNGLASAGLITMDQACCIESTEAGKLMSVYYVDLETMKLIMKIEGTETLDRLLWLICESHELSDMHLRMDERRCLNALNRNNTAATIRFPMKGKINTRQMKLYCVIQAVLGCLPIPDPSLNQEAMKIMRIALRVCMCLVAYTTRPTSICQQSKTFSAVLNSIILTKCIACCLWENSPYVSKQLRGIGPAFSALLASAGKSNFTLLEESHPRDLERIMNKGPPAGNVIRKQISLLPKYQLTITPMDRDSILINLALVNQCYLSENIDQLTAGANHKSYIVVGDSENHLLHLSSFKDTDLIRVYDGCIKIEVTRKHHYEHKVMAYCVSFSFVGIDVQSEYTFMNIGPIYQQITNNDVEKGKKISETACKSEFIENTNSRSRKRKINESVTCSKEKLKREKTLLESFKCLKESFGKTGKEMMGNLNVSTEMTNKALQNLTESKNSIDVNNSLELKATKDINKQENELLKSFVIDDPVEEEVFDADEVNKILIDIENEIKNRKTANQSINLTPSQQTALPIGLLRNNSLKVCEPKHKTRMPFKKTSNFNFIDLLERNNNIDVENDDIFSNNDGDGFTNTVKIQIDKYLKNAEKCRYSDIKHLLNSENEKVPIDTAGHKIFENGSKCDYDLSEIKKVTVCQNIEPVDDFSTARLKVSIENDIVVKDECDGLENLNKCGENISSNHQNAFVTQSQDNSDLIPTLLPIPFYEVNDDGKSKNTKDQIEIHSNDTDDFIITDEEQIKSSDCIENIETEILNNVQKRNVGENIRHDVDATKNTINIKPANEGKLTKFETPITYQSQFAIHESTLKTVNNAKICEKDNKQEKTSFPLNPTANAVSILNNKKQVGIITSIDNITPTLDSITECKLNNTIKSFNTNYIQKHSIDETQINVSTGNIYELKIVRTLDIACRITKITSKRKEQIDVNEPDVIENNNHNVAKYVESKYNILQSGTSNIQTKYDNGHKSDMPQSMPSNHITFNTQGNKSDQYITEHGSKVAGNINTLALQNVPFSAEKTKSKQLNKYYYKTAEDNTHHVALQEPLLTTDETENHKPNVKKCNTVEDIMKKYSTLMQSKPSEEVPVIKHTKFNSIKLPIDKPMRKYTISDIQNLQIPLPDILAPHDQNLNNLSQQIFENVPRKFGYDDNFNHNAQSSLDDIPGCQMPSVAHLLKEVSCELNSTMSSPRSKETDSIDGTYNVNKYLFDPRTLLQHYTSKDDIDEIIPPPVEFADFFSNPTRDMNNTTDAYTPSSPPDFYLNNIETKTRICEKKRRTCAKYFQ